VMMIIKVVMTSEWVMVVPPVVSVLSVWSHQSDMILFSILTIQFSCPTIHPGDWNQEFAVFRTLFWHHTPFSIFLERMRRQEIDCPETPGQIDMAFMRIVSVDLSFLTGNSRGLRHMLTYRSWPASTSGTSEKNLAEWKVIEGISDPMRPKSGFMSKLSNWSFLSTEPSLSRSEWRMSFW
jgi:hypothetical protein